MAKVTKTQEESHSSELGIFRIGKDFHDEEGKEADAFLGADPGEKERDQAVTDALLGRGLMVEGFRLRPIKLSTFALLRQVNSAYLTFIPLLAPEERKRLIALNELPSRSQKEAEEFVRLNTIAVQEASQIKNPFLETMTALLLLSVDTPFERAMELAYGPPHELRQAAYEFGDSISMHNYEKLSAGISEAIHAAQSTKVIPVPETGAKKVGNE